MMTRLQFVAARPRLLLWGYLVLIALAEIWIAYGGLLFGVALHALLLVGLVLHGALWRQTGRRMLLALTLAPLARLLSLVLPLAILPPFLWPLAVALPLLLATGILIRHLGVPRQVIGLRTGNLPLQLMIAGGGLGLGVLQGMIWKPEPIIDTFSWATVLPVALVLIIATGLVEELIFRGLLQALALPTLGHWGIMFVTLLFAALHISYRSLPEIALAFAVGLMFAFIARWSRSILGVALAHGLINVMVYLVNPFLEQQPTGRAAGLAPWIIWGWTAAAAGAAGMLMLRAVWRQRTMPAMAPSPIPSSVPAAYKPLVLALAKNGWIVMLLALFSISASVTVAAAVLQPTPATTKQPITTAAAQSSAGPTLASTPAPTTAPTATQASATSPAQATATPAAMPAPTTAPTATQASATSPAQATATPAATQASAASTAQTGATPAPTLAPTLVPTAAPTAAPSVTQVVSAPAAPAGAAIMAPGYLPDTSGGDGALPLWLIPAAMLLLALAGRLRWLGMQRGVKTKTDPW